MVEELTIKKSDLWKYATFALLIIVVIGAIFIFKGHSATGNNTNDTNAAAIDLSTFTSNSLLYPSVGPDNSKNTVVEFADFQCPYCALASGLPNWSSQYVSQYGDLVGVAKNIENAAEQGQLRFVFVPMNFLDRNGAGESTWAGEAAYCAGDQGKYFQMHDAIYAASTGPQEETGKYTKANLEIIAQSIPGLDQAKFKSCLENDTYITAIQASTSAAFSAGIQGTPAFFVNGKSVQPSWAAVQAALK